MNPTYLNTNDRGNKPDLRSKFVRETELFLDFHLGQAEKREPTRGNDGARESSRACPVDKDTIPAGKHALPPVQRETGMPVADIPAGVLSTAGV